MNEIIKYILSALIEEKKIREDLLVAFKTYIINENLQFENPYTKSGTLPNGVDIIYKKMFTQKLEDMPMFSINLIYNKKNIENFDWYQKAISQKILEEATPIRLHYKFELKLTTEGEKFQFDKEKNLYFCFVGSHNITIKINEIHAEIPLGNGIETPRSLSEMVENLGTFVEFKKIFNLYAASAIYHNIYYNYYSILYSDMFGLKNVDIINLSEYSMEKLKFFKSMSDSLSKFHKTSYEELPASLVVGEQLFSTKIEKTKYKDGTLFLLVVFNSYSDNALKEFMEVFNDFLFFGFKAKILISFKINEQKKEILSFNIEQIKIESAPNVEKIIFLETATTPPMPAQKYIFSSTKKRLLGINKKNVFHNLINYLKRVINVKDANSLNTMLDKIADAISSGFIEVLETIINSKIA